MQEAAGATLGQPAGVQHPVHSDLANANDQQHGCGNDALWKPKNGFHRDLEISHRARFPHSHKPIIVMMEKEGEERKLKQRK
jgi:hypothetical protein